MLRRLIPVFALAAVAGLAPNAPVHACNDSQCTLVVSDTPSPEAILAQQATTAEKPMRLDRFRSTAGRKAKSSRNAASPRAQPAATQRAKASKPRQAAPRADIKTAEAPRNSRQTPDTGALTPEAAGAFALQSAQEVPLGTDVKVVAADEINSLDLAAGPAPAPQTSDAKAAAQATSAPVRLAAAETTGRAMASDTRQSDIWQQSFVELRSAVAPAPGVADESWLRKMLLVLGGAFAAAAAAARLLLAA